MATTASKKYIEAINFTVADGAPAIELGDLTSNGQRGPSLSGGTGDVAISGGVAGPNRSQGGPGSTTLGGGVAGGPAVGSVDGSIVALVCDVMDEMFVYLERCYGEGYGYFTRSNEWFQGDTCEAWVRGTLMIDAQPLVPEAAAALTCIERELRSAPCDDAEAFAMRIEGCVPGR